MSANRLRAGMSLTSLVVLATALGLLTACGGPSSSFATREDAVAALVGAAEASDSEAMAAILGPGGEEIASSGDDIADTHGRESFVTLAHAGIGFDDAEDGTVVAVFGEARWPLPIPLVEEAGSWHFDSAAAKDEILSRRIGRNELKALAVCRAWWDAQWEYAQKGRDGNPPAFAQRLMSTPGKHDGLYWEAAEGEEESPVGDLVAKAADEHLQEGQPAQYHGYLFRTLHAQGPNAPGGARSYVVENGLMTGGFALLAWPIDHGNSGIMTLMVNQQGVVFQKDLGPETASAIKAIETYDPDDTWYPTGD